MGDFIAEPEYSAAESEKEVYAALLYLPESTKC